MIVKPKEIWLIPLTNCVFTYKIKLCNLRFVKFDSKGEIVMIYYGYARVSTPTQDIQRQVRNIREFYSKTSIVTEAYTGTKIDRPGWNNLYDNIMKDIENQKEVTVIFDSVSRMSRNADDGYKLYQELYDKGVNLIFLNEPHINTDTYKKATEKKIELQGTKEDIIFNAINEYLMELAKEQIKIAFDQAQKEVDDLRKRTSQGMATAKLKGKQIGQKKGARLHLKDKQPILEIIQEYSIKKGLKDKDVMIIINEKIYKGRRTKSGKEMNISVNTYYKYKKELKTPTK